MASELELLDPDVRRNADRVRTVLHPDFAEIGRSGRRWTQVDTIAALEQEEGRVAPETDEWMFNQVPPGLVLVTFRISTPAASSRHASLWDVSGSAPVILCHQGTPLPLSN
ncbi:nuclear transport factor 2 family protein [Microbacterium allomyrinae]|uniref:Nuclear transport factor 2 family protein n=1 Tax=Microbacterium allomyrinae TaxID=2830666 RepID=A0A9X1LSA9_9MICO|nr:nuclear transport factor 2 family protein [Microbacterium allomyrinae]MCC2031030.1 nuclear transport factor 2 family protein [Microbacterium allomyrinae]